ncbi:UNKNOWN [Stylonychia lemnae]|uniref:Uncharacterized protein n=1 Tax=Stylonychia lemnae TaxID=5949 RepID=A0A078B2A4_STYLE|nr:UNKNOWN [Stylonychia lemnae]|eukprot:CDW88670.1 UNKNOWN [Stylonychia lemnae]
MKAIQSNLRLINKNIGLILNSRACFSSNSNLSESQGKITQRSNEEIIKEYEKLFEYAKENLVYKCGNLTDMPSRFGFLKRWRHEKQLNYNNCKHPIFLYAYRAFIDALGKHDIQTVSKMCEKNLFRKIENNYKQVNSLNSRYFLIDKNIQMKMKLLDTKIVEGVYLDRSKNLSSSYYDVKETNEKINYIRKTKAILGKPAGIDFEVMLKDRKPQGINTGFQSEGSQNQQSNTFKEELSILQLDIQFASNLRIGIQHNDDENLTIGAPLQFNKEFEKHVLRFERYIKLPQELQVIRDKLKKEAMNDMRKLKEMKDEETLNPWLITDIDYIMDGNPYVVNLK